MRVQRSFVVSICIGLAALSVAARARAQRGGAPAAGPAMTLTIAAFLDGGQVPVKFSQAADGAAPGEGTSPAMSWSNVPPGTQSFVLNMHDMDVARNKTSDDQAHWVVWNIPATATGLPEGVPKGSQRPTAAIKSARLVRCIAARARRRMVRRITTCSSSLLSTRNSMCNRPLMRSRPAPTW
jgi:hypothetical protein